MHWATKTLILASLDTIEHCLKTVRLAVTTAESEGPSPRSHAPVQTRAGDPPGESTYLDEAQEEELASIFGIRVGEAAGEVNGAGRIG